MLMSTKREHFLPAGDGIDLYIQDLGSQSAERTLVLIHGYGEHGGRYLPLIPPFIEAGYRILLPDLRGHGRSKGKRGHVMSFEKYLDDVEVVMKLVDTPSEQTVLFGHSNGGLITLKWLVDGRSEVCAAAVTSPFLGLALKAPAWKLWAAKALSRWVPTLNLPSEIDAADVSHDPEVVQSYDTDPLIHHVANARWFTEAMSAIDEVFMKAPNISTPLLILQAGADKIADPEATRRWAGSAPSQYVTYQEVEGLFHEVLFELNGEKQRDKILHFFNEQLAKTT